jgi:hypothetical protein
MSYYEVLQLLILYIEYDITTFYNFSIVQFQISESVVLYPCTTLHIHYHITTFHNISAMPQLPSLTKPWVAGMAGGVVITLEK